MPSHPDRVRKNYKDNEIGDKNIKYKCELCSMWHHGPPNIKTLQPFGIINVCLKCKDNA